MPPTRLDASARHSRADTLTGNGGNDTFVFDVGQANGDAVVDFAGRGAAAGDLLEFVGYGAGASFTNIDATQWQVNYNGGDSHEIIAFLNGARVDPSDVLLLKWHGAPWKTCSHVRDNLATAPAGRPRLDEFLWSGDDLPHRVEPEDAATRAVTFARLPHGDAFPVDACLPRRLTVSQFLVGRAAPPEKGDERHRNHYRQEDSRER
jgi:hypothetical protein